MHFIRNMIAWVFYYGFLLAVGIVIFVVVRYQPRCTITGPLTLRHLSADGKHLVTESATGKDSMCGVLQFWSTTETGNVRQLLGENRAEKLQQSLNGRFTIARLDGGRYGFADCDLGRDRAFDDLPRLSSVRFSPKSRWLLAVIEAEPRSIIFDLVGQNEPLSVEDTGPRFGSDDRHLFSRRISDREIEVWDLLNARITGKLLLESGHWLTSPDWQILTAPDGGTLLTWFAHAEPVTGKLQHTIHAWDLTTGRLRFQRSIQEIENLKATFSPDSRQLVLWLHDRNKQSNLETLDVSTGKTEWSYAMKMAGEFDFLPDGTVCHLVHTFDNGTKWLTVLNATNGDVLWQRACQGQSYVAGNSDTVIHQVRRGEPFEFLDVRSGQRKAVMPSNFPTSNNVPVLTPSGRQFVIAGSRSRGREPYFWELWLEKRWPNLFGEGVSGALVMDSVSGHEMFRVVNYGKQEYRLSDDGGTLLTVDALNDDVQMIRIWDVHPHRAWIWSLVSVAATILLWFAASRSLRALRYRRETAGAKRRTTQSTNQLSHPVQ